MKLEIKIQIEIVNLVTHQKKRAPERKESTWHVASSVAPFKAAISPSSLRW